MPSPRTWPARLRRRWRWRPVLWASALAVAVALMAVAAASFVSGPPPPADPPAGPTALPRLPAAYLGVFAPPSPLSYSGVDAFAAATGVRPGLVVYYSGWLEPFQRGFAAAASRHRAVPLVQIDPTDISMAAIAAGRYDAYLRSYAAAVRSFGGRTILSFGHEMNAPWYSWGYGHVRPSTFVAAWRHIVGIFRAVGARNVTWLWTVNVIDRRAGVASPVRWWPGSSYVNWVGLDGYYRKPSWTFAALFGPTIKAVRTKTIAAPVLISETSAAPAAGQPAKITNLFAGVHEYGLLGFVWFDVGHRPDWRLRGQPAIGAYRRGAKTFRRPSA